MKKRIALMLCLLLAFASLAQALDIDTRFLGDWYLHTFRVDDTSFNAGDSGLIVKYTIEGDGTATRTDPDGSREFGTWTSLDDTMTISWDDGSWTDFLYIEGALVSVPEKGSLVIHLESYPPPQPEGEQLDYRKDAKAKDFDGHWISVSITMPGFTVSMSDLDQPVDPEIKGGKLVAINGVPVLPDVSSRVVGSTLVITNLLNNFVSAMNLLTDGSATLRHLEHPDVYFTLIPLN